MMEVLFSARRVNWSAHAADWPDGGETRYAVYTDGTVESPWGRAALSPQAFARLKELLTGDFCRAATHHNAFDGEGWEMTLYAGNGHIIHETGLGYIYGVTVLEEIAALLRGAEWPGGGPPPHRDIGDEILSDILRSLAAEQRKKKRFTDEPPEISQRERRANPVSCRPQKS